MVGKDYSISNAKSKEVLGMTYERDAAESLREMIISCAKNG